MATIHLAGSMASFIISGILLLSVFGAFSVGGISNFTFTNLNYEGMVIPIGISLILIIFGAYVASLSES
jgi:hypothetical protein